MSSDQQMEMQSNPLRQRRAVASDSDGSVHPEGVKVSMPTDKCASCGHAPEPVKSVWRQRWEFVKRNLPAIISIASVILNVVIISRLIPDMQSSISVMQGQAQSVQSQVNSINGLLFGVNDKINDANIKIDTFNGLVGTVTQTLNTTQTNILSFSEQTQADLVVMRTTAAQTLAGFQNSSRTIERQLNASQASADATLIRVETASSALDVKFAQYSNAADASLQQLLMTNATVLSRVESVRDDFTDRIVPEVTANLQSLNMSSAIEAVAFIDPFHYVGSATTGLGSVWVSMVPYSTDRLPRFWRDRDVVHMEGLMKSSGSCSVPCAAFTLPPLASYLPNDYRYLPTAAQGGLGSITIWTNGDVVVQSGDPSYISLDGLAFSVK